MGEKTKIWHFKIALLGLVLVLSCGRTSIVQAATQYFSPSGGSYSTNATFQVAIYATSADQPASAFSGDIHFQPELLNVVSVSKADSVVSMWVREPSYSNTEGTLHFEGFVPNPGYLGSNGKLLTITFAVKGSGTANLLYTDGAVLANDGQGTDITDGLGSASFAVGINADDAAFNPEVEGFSTAIEEDEPTPGQNRVQTQGDTGLAKTNTSLAANLSSNIVAFASPMWERGDDSPASFSGTVDNLGTVIQILIFLVVVLLILVAVAATVALLLHHAHRHANQAVHRLTRLQPWRVRRTLKLLRHDLHKNLRRLEAARRRSPSNALERTLREASHTLNELEDEIGRWLDRP